MTCRRKRGPVFCVPSFGGFGFIGALVAEIIAPFRQHESARSGLPSRHRQGPLGCPLRVASGPSELYHLKGRYRVHTGRSATIFQRPKFERLLFPKADVQTIRKSRIRQAANGQERTFNLELWSVHRIQSAWLSSTPTSLFSSAALPTWSRLSGNSKRYCQAYRQVRYFFA